jgi:hypothetical protein
LEAEGVKTFAVDEMAAHGDSLRDIVQESVNRADMVVVVLPGQAPQENVLIELGVALACEKPILIIADEKVALPGIAAGIPYLRADLGNAETLRFGLTHFLAAPHLRKPSGKLAAKQTHPLGRKADELLASLRELPKQPASQFSLENLIAEAVSASGVAALSQRKQVEDAEIDLAVWSDDLEPWVSNPLLIEVKRALKGKGDLDTLVHRFDQAYGQGRPGWGLVIYREAASDADLARVKHLHPTILFISAEEFLTCLRDTSFGDLVVRLRNDRMHGRG